MNLVIVIEMVAVLSAGLFAGAAIYINAVEHPARMMCDTDLALRQWRPSYKRATIMQASLALVSTISSLVVWFKQDNPFFLAAGILIGLVIPFTLLIIYPTNNKLMTLDVSAEPAEIERLLQKWNRLHMVRSLLSTLAFCTLLMEILA